MGGGGSRGHGRWKCVPKKRISPQMIAFALLLVSTGNLMLAVVPSAGMDGADSGGGGGGGGAVGSDRSGGGGGGGGDGDGLGELGEAVVDDGGKHAPVSCAGLPIDEADECLRERNSRMAERDARRKKGGGGGGGAPEVGLYTS
jgi:hypothetical protein